MLKKISHVGLAVTDLESSVKLYESLGFEIIKRFHKPDINVDVTIVAKGETTFELLVFHDPNHPQAEFIRNHVAIYSDSIKEDVDKLLQQGYKLTIPITEGVIFRFAYVKDKSGTNYEIVTDKNQPIS